MRHVWNLLVAAIVLGPELAAPRELNGAALTTLLFFNGTNGIEPCGSLVLGSDGCVYGATCAGGASWGQGPDGYGYGSVFKITTNGIFTTVSSFDGTQGTGPLSGIAQGADQALYGTTLEGGTFGLGTVFRMTTNGIFSTIASFDGTNGGEPVGGLARGSDGAIYGTGASGGVSGDGTLFRVTTNGVFTILVVFNGTNGAFSSGSLLQGTDGNLYGTTELGGSDTNLVPGATTAGLGTIFSLGTNGVLTTLVSFHGTNGAVPEAGLVQGTDGSFYGTTAAGGPFWGQGPMGNGYGTVFKLASNGLLSTLGAFNNTNGAWPIGNMIQGTDGNLYGTTVAGGPYTNQLVDGYTGYGTVFKCTTNGVLSTLIAFNGTNGASPFPGGLLQTADGTIYGTTTFGGPFTNEVPLGSSGYGTIFRLVLAEPQPQFTSISKLPKGIQLTGTGPANQGYRVWASTNIILPVSSWTFITSNSFDSNGNLIFSDTNSQLYRSRYYTITTP